MAEIHDRMPVILDPDDWQTWLTAAPDEVKALLRPLPSDRLEAYPVSTEVNKPQNNTPSVIEPLPAS